MDELNKVYEEYGSPGINKFKKILKELGLKHKSKDVDEFVKKQTSNQVFNEPKKKSGHIVSFQYMDRVQIDIIDMSKFYNTNSHYKYILLIIDIFSRKLWAFLLKNKTIDAVDNALGQFLEKEHPHIIISDNESAFISKQIQDLLAKKDIKHITADVGDHHVLGVIDRACRTIKVMLFKYMKSKNTTKYIDALPGIIQTYNKTPHAGIKDMTPEQASKDEEGDIFNLNIDKSKHNKPASEYHEGDTVRVRNRKTKFERAYDEKYGPVMKIKSVNKRTAVFEDGSKADLRRLKRVVAESAAEEEQKDEVKTAVKTARVARKVKQAGVVVENVQRKRRDWKPSEKILGSFA